MWLTMLLSSLHRERKENYIMLEKKIQLWISCCSNLQQQEDQRTHSNECLAHLFFWKSGLTHQHQAGQVPLLHWIFPTS